MALFITVVDVNVDGTDHSNERCAINVNKIKISKPRSRIRDLIETKTDDSRP